MPNSYLISSSCMLDPQPGNIDNKCSIFNKMAVPIRHKWSPSFPPPTCIFISSSVKTLTDFHPPVSHALALFPSIPLDQMPFNFYLRANTFTRIVHKSACHALKLIRKPSTFTMEVGTMVKRAMLVPCKCCV